MNTTQEDKIPIDTIAYWANRYTKELTDENQIELQDITETFLHELEDKIRKGELINININGRVRKGKSTLSFALGTIILGYLKKYKKTEQKKPFGWQNITRDQQEYSQKMRDSTLKNTILTVDEHNDLEEGGENVTIEKQLNQVFSKVQAARYVHKIGCSPTDVTDPNSEYHIEIQTIQNGTTYAKLYYRFQKATQEYTQLVGHIRINVQPIIKNWILIEQTFYKDTKTPQEQKLIQNLSEKDFYVEYMIKKMQKMELITKEGIYRPRELEYAHPILNTIRRLKDLCTIPKIITQDTVKNYIKMEFRNSKIPQSIIGEEIATRRALGVLNIYKNYHEVQLQLNHLKQKQNKSNNPMEQEIIQTKIEKLDKIKNDLATTGQQQTEELEHYITINKNYQNIINT